MRTYRWEDGIKIGARERVSLTENMNKRKLLSLPQPVVYTREGSGGVTVRPRILRQISLRYICIYSQIVVAAVLATVLAVFVVVVKKFKGPGRIRRMNKASSRRRRRYPSAERSQIPFGDRKPLLSSVRASLPEDFTRINTRTHVFYAYVCIHVCVTWVTRETRVFCHRE